MSQSMWSYSGAHWLRSWLCWIGFALILSMLPGGPTDSASAANEASALALPRLKFANPLIATAEPPRLVTHDVRPLDLSALPVSAFGDEADAPAGN